MAIYKLTPLNPADGVWLHLPFVESVWINARDEHQARVGVSAAALRLNPDLMRSPHSWPWLYFARCTIDETHARIGRGEVVDARGRRLGSHADSPIAVESRSLAPIVSRKRGSERAADPPLRLAGKSPKGRMTGRQKRALH
jgi:hypothetical protein